MNTTLFKGLNRAAGLIKQANLTDFMNLFTKLRLPGKLSAASRVGRAGSSAARNKALDALNETRRAFPDADLPKHLSIINEPLVDDIQTIARMGTEPELRAAWEQLKSQGYRFGKGGLQRLRPAAGPNGELTELVDEAALRNILAQDKTSWAGRLLADAKKANIMGDHMPSFTKAFAEFERGARRAANKTAAKPLTRYNMPKDINTSKLTADELRDYGMYGPSSLAKKHKRLAAKIQERLSGQGKVKTTKTPPSGKTAPAPKNSDAPAPISKDAPAPKDPDVPVEAPGVAGADDVAESSLAKAIARHPWLTLSGTGLAGGGAGYAIAAGGAPDEAEIARRIAAAQASNPTAADLQAYYNY